MRTIYVLGFTEPDKLLSSRRAQALPRCFRRSSMQTLSSLEQTFPPAHFLAGVRIAFIVVFLTNKNFGRVRVPIKVSFLFSVNRVVISTVA